MIIFRADISSQTGLQHLHRCAYLAALLKKNNEVLICSREDKKTAKFLAERNIPTRFLNDPSAIDLAGVHAVVFDLPNFSAQDCTLLKKAIKAGVKTVQIVSAGGEFQPADICVFPLPGPAPMAAAETKLLAGAEYALLHHKFRHFHKAKRKYHKNIKNIFINLGDLLPYRDLRQTIDTLHRLHLNMKIAPGLNLKKADKRNLLKIYPGSHFCGKSESPARAYFEADLALIPAGEAALEAASVGTPALYMPLDKIQEGLCETCKGFGSGVPLPSLSDWSVQSIRDTLVSLNLERREAMSFAGKKLVNGLGVQKFFKILKDNGIVV